MAAYSPRSVMMKLIIIIFAIFLSSLLPCDAARLTRGRGEERRVAKLENNSTMSHSFGRRYGDSRLAKIRLVNSFREPFALIVYAAPLQRPPLHRRARAVVVLVLFLDNISRKSKISYKTKMERNPLTGVVINYSNQKKVQTLTGTTVNS
ncbi:hypothetical protein RHMOL_Rhmol08G0304900 [Rhododendron molle]|uniref:Uncharacterized protein n=1 Tax=Rhododendron molle TaxID=49168 RepID=A0ACC0MVB4_RHOML|nr:hypothetical protein RHMOL_Rhmol08G0304900 [Rhododendron molle]